MDEKNDVLDEWKEILNLYFKQKIPTLVMFKYPQFDSPTIRRGKLLRIGDHSFTIEDVKNGIEHYSYKYVIEVKEIKGESI